MSQRQYASLMNIVESSLLLGSAIHIALALPSPLARSRCGTEARHRDRHGHPHVPERHTGRASIVVDLGEQKRISTAASIEPRRPGFPVAGRHRTPTAYSRSIRKDEDHRLSLYGDYVDDSGRVREGKRRLAGRIRKPRPARFVGATMPFYRRISPRSDCTRVICLACLRRMAVSGCRIGKRGSFTTPRVSGPAVTVRP